MDITNVRTQSFKCNELSFQAMKRTVTIIYHVFAPLRRYFIHRETDYTKDS
jgi:hypothetical protein